MLACSPCGALLSAAVTGGLALQCLTTCTACCNFWQAKLHTAARIRCVLLGQWEFANRGMPMLHRFREHEMSACKMSLHIRLPTASFHLPPSCLAGTAVASHHGPLHLATQQQDVLFVGDVLNEFASLPAACYDAVCFQLRRCTTTCL